MRPGHPLSPSSNRVALAVAVVVAAAIAGALVGGWSDDEGESADPQPADAATLAAAEYRASLTTELEALGEARAAGLESLRAAATAGGQARAARGLAAAFQRSAGRVATLSAPAPLDTAHDALLRSLQSAFRAYSEVARAAGRGRASAYLEAQRDVRRAEVAVRRAVAATLNVAEPPQ